MARPHQHSTEAPPTILAQAAGPSTTEHRDFSSSAHGRHSGPASAVDYAVIVVAVVIVAVVVVLFIKYLFWPGETSPEHIKRRILRDDWEEGQS